MKNNNLNSQEDGFFEIIRLLKKLIQNRVFILKTTSIFALLGIIVALQSPLVYSAKTSFIPQSTTQVSGSGLKGLASLAGINLQSVQSEGNEISPLIYPKLAQSTSFVLELLTENISNNGSLIRLDSYLMKKSSGFQLSSIVSFIKKYTIGLPSLIFSSVVKKEISDDNAPSTSLIKLSKEQKGLVELLNENISVIPNEKQGFLEIEVNDNNPLIAAQITLLVTSKLQEIIIEKRIEKANNNLLFIQEEFDLNNKEFKEIQNRLAQFKDRNQNISSASFMINLQRLEAEFEIALSVVQQLANQVEQAKIQVNKDTPIFTVIEPVVVPSDRSAPKRGRIVLIWLFFGIILSAGYVLLKAPFRDFYSKITTTKK
jgi:uncharacterized protein involved in exopolysaccharide biosynthesis